MPINMQNTYDIDKSEQQSLVDSEVRVFNGGTSGAGTPGAQLAGISQDFASSFAEAMNTYISGIDTKLEEFQQVGEATAFKGEGLQEAIRKFVSSVREAANRYTAKLKQAEIQIVNSVDAAYAAQDSSLSGDMSSDTSAVSSSVSL